MKKKSLVLPLVLSAAVFFMVGCPPGAGSEDKNTAVQPGDPDSPGDSGNTGQWDGVPDTEFSGDTDAAAVLAAIRTLETDSGDYESAVPDSGKDTVVPAVTGAVSIVLANGNSSVTGNPLNTIDIDNTNNVITITGSTVDTYALSGSLSDGQVIADVSKSVNLILNGVNITSSKGAPLALFGSKKKTITLAAGTQNTLTDAAAYTSFYQSDDEPNGALFSKKALTINGTGELTVNGNYNNGISCKDNLKIMGGTITVTAPNNALKGNDSVVIKGGNLKLSSSADGIKSDAEDEGAGYVYIGGDAAVSITSAEDGIQAYRAVHILENPVVNITSGGGSTSKTTGYDGDSCKGIKSDLNLLIEGGTFTLNCLDDAVHSNNAALISGGTFSIKTDDDAIHGDALAVINGGTISITKSYEGLEAANVVVNGGTISIVSSDDGINAADGTTTTSPPQRPGRPGQGGTSASTNCAITINGGNITVNSGGDGIDSNGNVWISGGLIVVHGPASSGDNSLDSDGTFFIDGGTLIAAGPSGGMAQNPSTTSTQYSLSFTFKSKQNAETQVVLKDSGGNTIAAYTAAKQFQSLIISSPDLVNGGVYSLYTGNTLSKTCTVSNKVTTVSL
ncbi:hypothetical protein AGMMS4952_11820 [Spirochaetia bacterium]|nr:hypothetical protein AGMMS4952_11820 [Spirochaetia bacterium]